jgi:hypothetical protein
MCLHQILEWYAGNPRFEEVSEDRVAHGVGPWVIRIKIDPWAVKTKVNGMTHDVSIGLARNVSRSWGVSTSTKA